MKIELPSQEKAGLLDQGWRWLGGLPGMCKNKFVRVAKRTKKLAQDDSSRIIHGLKVGLAITLTSVLYYQGALYDGFGASGDWVVLSTLFVFEFTAGATLGKCLNRSFGTLVGGAVGTAVQSFASLFGKKGRPIVLGILLFLLTAAATFIRFIPGIKARYDNAVLIFILTFCMVVDLGYQTEDTFWVAHERFFTVVIGAVTCVIISIFVCPIWAGENLHNSISSKIEKLANSLQGFGGEYFQDSENKDSVTTSTGGKALLQGYKSVIDSKSTEESLASLARWEPGHGRFRFRHPWKCYLKIGALARQSAYRIEALNDHINSDVQAPLELRNKIRESSLRMSSESSKALKALALAIKTMTDPSVANLHVENSKVAINDLYLALKATSLENLDTLAVISVASVASILIEITRCAEKIYESVQELSHLAHFRSVEPTITFWKPSLWKLKPCFVSEETIPEGTTLPNMTQDSRSTAKLPSRSSGAASSHAATTLPRS